MKIEFQTPGINVGGGGGIFNKIREKIISHSVHYLPSAELLLCQQQKISRSLREKSMR